MVILPIFTHLDYANMCAFVCVMATYRLLPGVLADSITDGFLYLGLVFTMRRHAVVSLMEGQRHST